MTGVERLAWLRHARRRLRVAGIDQVLVWDDHVASLLVPATAGIADLVWARDARDVGAMGVARRIALVLAVQRVVTAPDIHLRAFRHKQVIAPACDDPEVSAALDDGSWCVLLGQDPGWTASDSVAVEQRAQRQPAAFVCVDAQVALERRPALVLQAQALARTDRVLVCSDARWTGEVSEALPLGVQSHDRRLREGGVARMGTGPDLGLADTAPAPGRDPLAAWCRGALQTGSRSALVEQEGQPIERCPSCGSQARLPGPAIAGGLRALRCSTCGLLHAGRVLPAELLHTPGYHDGSELFGADYRHAVAERASFDLAAGRLGLLAQVGVSGRLLDVGAGYGHFVLAAQEHGWKAEGLEVVAAAAARAAHTYGLDLHVGDVRSFEPEGRYDAVTFGQTLEHMIEPVAVLERVRDVMLVPGGRVLLELPNARSLARVLAGPAWMHWQPGDHVLYPDASSLGRLLDAAGFEVERLESNSLVFDWMDASMIAFNLGAVSRPLTGGLLRVLLRRNADKDWPASVLRLAVRALDARGYGQDLRVVARARS